MSPSGVRTSFRNRWQHLVNDNNNGQGNNSDVLYSELQTQKLGAWGIEEMAITGGVVHQYTKGEAQLYTGGNEDGINTARNIAGIPSTRSAHRRASKFICRNEIRIFCNKRRV